MSLGSFVTRRVSFGATAALMRLALVSAPLALQACSATPTAAEVPASTGAGGQGGGQTDAAASGSGARWSADAMQLAPANGAPASAPPGAYITSETATGTGVSTCSTTTLGAVLDTIRAADPTLADVRTIYDPATASIDGSFIYAYDVGTLGYDIVFKRAIGDCAAGCTDNDYQYFSTNAACQPVKVGHYHATWGTGTCLTVDGTPMWTHPSPPDPLTVCGADNSPRDLRGTYAVTAAGQRTACAVNATATSVARVAQMVIDQSAQDLGTGTVTFSSTGDPLVDGIKLPARFQRWRFDAALPSNAPSVACPRAASITARYDFEGYEQGSLDALEAGDDGCGACKGSLSIDLSAATLAK